MPYAEEREMVKNAPASFLLKKYLSMFNEEARLYQPPFDWILRTFSWCGYNGKDERISHATRNRKLVA
jgi:hypothetical protein